MNADQIIFTGKRTVNLEAEALTAIAAQINEAFSKAVQAIAASEGRVVVTGIGKSAIIAQKITATFNSTGTPALFMHAADAIHGDLGMIQQHDVVIIISKSGNTPEVKVLIPFIRSFKNTIIAIAGNMDSYLAQQADIVLNTTVSQEACPNNLAPTTSTVAQLAMGDALAVSLMELKGFQRNDFARYHPGGALGKKLYLKISDLVLPDENPKVEANATIAETILEMTSKRLGATAIVDAENNVSGIVTDGDIRRMVEKHANLAGLTAKDIMGKSPKSMDKDALAIEAFEVLKTNNINQLVITHNGKYFGILHLQDLIREGII